MVLLDGFQRKLNYLRISVTERCNLRCQYCIPENQESKEQNRTEMSAEEILLISQAAISCGFSTIRLTGGEPLVRQDFPEIAYALARLPGLNSLSLTTNGTLLAPIAKDLKHCGINRVNISIDSLRADRYKTITRGGSLSECWRGIEAALASKLNPVKLNVVVMDGFNEDECVDFVELAQNYPLHVRFIELMPIGPLNNHALSNYCALDHFRDKISRDTPLIALPGEGPATAFAHPNWRGSVGFINSVSHLFCHQCNRLRLTSDGRLRTCLYSEQEIDLLTPLRNLNRSGDSTGTIATTLQNLIGLAAATKPASRNALLDLEQTESFDKKTSTARYMTQIGG